jgi:hypothetical protein
MSELREGRPVQDHGAVCFEFGPQPRRCRIAFGVCALFLLAATPRAIALDAQRCARSSDLASLIACGRTADNERAKRCADEQSEPMRAPVEGRRLVAFGDTTQLGSSSRGIVFQTTIGASVRAPAEGFVTFAGPYRSYGNLLIIDACARVAVVAGPLAFEVTPGAKVRAGAVVAKVANTNSEDPVIYFEVRRAGAPVDPGQLSDN